MHEAIIIIGIFPLVAAIGDVVQVRPCAGGFPVPREVRVAGCASVPCPVRRGQDADAEVDFTAPYSISTLRSRVVPVALGLELPYELPAEYSRACDWLIGSSCPIAKGDEVTYNLKIPVKRNYPKIRLNIELSLTDDDNRTLFCFVLGLKVV